MTKFFVSKEADNDLGEIWQYIAENNPVAANKVEDSIFEAFNFLAENPLSGHLRHDLTDKDLRFWNVYSYQIIYDYNSKPITIIRVLSGYRDLTSLLE